MVIQKSTKAFRVISKNVKRYTLMLLMLWQSLISSPSFCLTFPSINQPICLSIIRLPVYLPIFLSFSFSLALSLSSFLLIYPSVYRVSSLSIYIPFYMFFPKRKIFSCFPQRIIRTDEPLFRHFSPQFP